MNNAQFRYGANQCGPPMLNSGISVESLSLRNIPRNQCDEYVRCKCTNSLESLACPKGNVCRLDKNLGNVCYNPATNEARLPYPYCQN